jgi:hypothetical protein
MLLSASVELNISADGQRLNSVKYNFAHDFSEYFEDYTPTSTLEQTYIYGEDGVICGIDQKIDVTAFSLDMINWTEDENGNYTDESVALAINAKSNFKIDLSKIGTSAQDVMVFDIDMTVDKAVKITSKGNWMEGTEEIISSAPVAEEEYGEYFDAVDMEFKLTSTDANKLSFKGTVTPEAGEGKVEFNATIYLNDILNFPTELPAEVTEYMTAE